MAYMKRRFAHRIAMNPIDLILPAVLGLVLSVLLCRSRSASRGMSPAGFIIAAAVGVLLGMLLPWFGVWLLG
jgi:hypothetical protein